MKLITKIAFFLAFIMPYGIVSADTHDDATMEVIEHSSADHFENEIELPEKEDHDDDKNHDGKEDSHDEKDDSADEKEESHDEKDDSSKD